MFFPDFSRSRGHSLKSILEFVKRVFLKAELALIFHKIEGDFSQIVLESWGFLKFQNTREGRVCYIFVI